MAISDIKRFKRASTSFSLEGGLDNFLIFKRDGEAFAAGISDALRDSRGQILSGEDVRKSDEFKALSGRERKEVRRRLSSGVILTKTEFEEVLDKDGNPTEEFLKNSVDGDSAEGVNKTSEIAKMEQMLEEFNKRQAEAEQNITGAEEEEDEDEEDDRRRRREERGQNEGADRSLGVDSGGDSGQSGDVAKTRSFIDDEVRGLLNQIQSLETPEGGAV